MLKRFLLAALLLVLCGPALALLLLGLPYLPVFLLGAIADRGHWAAGAVMTVGGAWGAVSLLGLAGHVLHGGRRWPGRPAQWCGLAAGLVACGTGLWTLAGAEPMGAVFAGPILATAWLLHAAGLRRPPS